MLDIFYYIYYIFYYIICSFMSLDQQDLDLYEIFQKNLRRNLVQSARGRWQ